MEKKEINALVAAKVMGYHLWDFAGDYEGEYPCYWLDGDDVFVYLTEDDGENGDVDLFDPEHDIADAWRVVEVLGKTWDVELSRHFQGHCICMFTRIGNYRDTDAEAGTMPLAICLAALKTVGVNVKELEHA